MFIFLIFLTASPIGIEEDLVFASLHGQPSEVPDDIMRQAERSPFNGSIVATATTSPGGSVDPPLPPLPPEMADGHWRTVLIGGAWRRIDMTAIAPYRRCISDGGDTGGGPAVVVVAACLMPDRRVKNYHYCHIIILSEYDNFI